MSFDDGLCYQYHTVYDLVSCRRVSASSFWVICVLWFDLSLNLVVFAGINWILSAVAENNFFINVINNVIIQNHLIISPMSLLQLNRLHLSSSVSIHSSLSLLDLPSLVPIFISVVAVVVLRLIPFFIALFVVGFV